MQERKCHRKMKQQATLLAAALTQWNPRTRTIIRVRAIQVRSLGSHQCAYCTEEAHWKRKCPSSWGLLRRQSPKLAPPRCLNWWRVSRNERAQWFLCTLHSLPSFPTRNPRLRGQISSDFLIDTGATYSVLNTWPSWLSNQTMAVMGISWEVLTKTFLQPLDCHIGQTHLKHNVL